MLKWGARGGIDILIKSYRGHTKVIDIFYEMVKTLIYSYSKSKVIVKIEIKKNRGHRGRNFSLFQKK